MILLLLRSDTGTVATVVIAKECKPSHLLIPLAQFTLSLTVTYFKTRHACI